MRVSVNFAETGIWQKPLGLRRPGDPPAELKVMLHVGRSLEGVPRFTADLTHSDNVGIEKLAVGEDLEAVLQSAELRLDELSAMDYVAISEPARLTEGMVLTALPWALEYVDAYERDGVPPPLPDDWPAPAAVSAPERQSPPLSDPPGSAADLPELDGELRFVWDTTGGDADPRTSITHEGRILWTEPGRWEGISRFVDVVALLREGYGDRFCELAPTQRSWLYLYGDDMSAPQQAVDAQLPEIRDARIELEYAYEPDEHGEPRWTVTFGGRAILRDWFDRPRYGALTYRRTCETLAAAFRPSRVSMRLSPEAFSDVFGLELPDVVGESLGFELETNEGTGNQRLCVDGELIWSGETNNRTPGEWERLLEARYGPQFGELRMTSGDDK